MTQPHRTFRLTICRLLPLQVPLGRLAALNKPELPAVVTGLAGSAALGLMMPGGRLLHTESCVVLTCCPAAQRSFWGVSLQHSPTSLHGARRAHGRSCKAWADHLRSPLQASPWPWAPS